MHDFLGGVIGFFAILIVLLIGMQKASHDAEKVIAESCELSGHVVIRGNAYKCELIQ